MEICPCNSLQNKQSFFNVDLFYVIVLIAFVQAEVYLFFVLSFNLDFPLELSFSSISRSIVNVSVSLKPNVALYLFVTVNPFLFVDKISVFKSAVVSIWLQSLIYYCNYFASDNLWLYLRRHVFFCDNPQVLWLWWGLSHIVIVDFCPLYLKMLR